jgi:ATP-binding cassette subfamily B protein
MKSERLSWAAGSATPKPWKSARLAIGFAMRGQARLVATITAAAFLGGLAEALFLITATRAAFAIAGGKDRVGIASGSFLSVRFTLFLAVILVAVRIALAGYTSWQSAKVSSGVVAGLRHRLNRAFLDSSWEVQQTQRSGSFQQLLGPHSITAGGLMASVTQAVVAGANLFALLGMAVAVDPVGALALVVSVIVLGLLLRPLRSVVRHRARSATAAGMGLGIAANEVSQLGLELQVFHVQGKAQAYVGEAIERARQAGGRLQFATGLSTPAYTGLAYLAMVGALAVVAASNTTSFTTMGAGMLVMLRSLGYAQAAQGAYLGVLGAVPAIEELQHHVQVLEAGRRVEGGQPVDGVGSIALERVSFAYPQGETVLRDLSFTIAPREIVGIVGPSGAGKSTLVQLLLGLRDPIEGHVLIDGREISTLDRNHWARKVTFVPQAAHLIAGTITDNIRFFRDGVSQEEVERAARLAHFHDEISRFSEGYERQVGEHGGHLSGGQQQRLCIARALVEDPDVLILDEPTSALDARSEHLIRSTLLDMKERMTVIVIAHRLSTLTICDRIMVIKDGELTAFDTPLALGQSSDFFREALMLSEGSETPNRCQPPYRQAAM